MLSHLPPSCHYDLCVCSVMSNSLQHHLSPLLRYNGITTSHPGFFLSIFGVPQSFVLHAVKDALIIFLELETRALEANGVVSYYKWRFWFVSKEVKVISFTYEEF